MKKKLLNMSKEELDELILKAENYYRQCVDEWHMLEQEYRQADEDCDTAEERLEELKLMRRKHG